MKKIKILKELVDIFGPPLFAVILIVPLGIAFYHYDWLIITVPTVLIMIMEQFVKDPKSTFGKIVECFIVASLFAGIVHPALWVIGLCFQFLYILCHIERKLFHGWIVEMWNRKFSPQKQTP